MRKADLYSMQRDDAVALLERAKTIAIASSARGGRPVLRVVHGVVHGDAIAFHGAPVGEKMDIVDREAVVQASEMVASIPSYFVDAERACPATTYYRSVQVHGTVELVTEPNERAEIARALMKKFQPEGNHVPIEVSHPRYRAMYEKAIAGLLIAKVSFRRIEGKAKLGQNRRPEERLRIVEALWRRRWPGDAEAILAIYEANPGTPLPSFAARPSASGPADGVGSA